MTKIEREIFQRNLMVAIKLIVEAYELKDPTYNLYRAQEQLREAISLCEDHQKE